MKRAWIFTALAIAPSAPWADYFEQIVTFDCNQGMNQLIIDHKGAFNDDGNRLVKSLHGNESNIRSLMILDAQGIPRGTQIIKHACNLRGASYEVIMLGVAGGRYGQDQSAHVIIRNDTKTLFDADLQGSSFSDPNSVIPRIVVSIDAEESQVSTTTSNWW